MTSTAHEPPEYEAVLHWMVLYPTIRWIFFWAAALGLVVFFDVDVLLQNKFHAPLWILWPLGALAVGLVVSSLVSQSVVILTTRIYLTTHKLFLRTGWFNVQQMELPLKQIESTSVHQDFWGKLFNYGVVTFYGTGGRQPRAFWVVDPTALTQVVGRLQDKQD